MLALRALLFYLGMSLAMLMFLPTQPVLALLPYQGRYRVLTLWGNFTIWWLGVTCNLYYEVEGRENIPTETAIIFAKHQSAWETIALQQIFPPQTWVLKRSLLLIPVFGWSLALLESIGIDRGAGRKALKQVIEKGSDRLRRGIWVVIFPEGTRMAPGQRGHYNIGGAMLAEKSGFPVVPVAHNAGEFWPRHGFIKHPGVIQVAIGPTIHPQGKKAGAINREAEEWIEAKMAQISNIPHQG